MCKVSIIMTSYNKTKYVGRAIEGILNQSFKDFELLLMDDNSNEETQKVIKKYLKDCRVRIFRSQIKDISERVKKNRYAAQINKALTMVKGQYISYATDDNVYRPNRLKKMVQFLECSPDIKIVYSGSRVAYLDNNDQIKRTFERYAEAETWFAPCQIDHCSIMHRADILPIIYRYWGSYWDEDPQFYLLGDARFFWRLNHFWPFVPINEILDDNYITKISLHAQIETVEASPLIRELPIQRGCNELREYQKNFKEINFDQKMNEEQEDFIEVKRNILRRFLDQLF